MAYSKEVRVDAAHAWKVAQDRLRRAGRRATDACTMREAIRVLKEMRPGLQLVRAGRFISRWRDRLEATQSVEDKVGRGCKSKLTPEMASRAVDILVEGCQPGSAQHQPWVDIHHALRGSKELEAIRARAGINGNTLWRRLLRHDPGLTRRWVQMKRVLTDEQKSVRAHACQLLLDKGDKLSDYIKRSFFIDSKKLWVQLRRAKYVCHTRQPVAYLHHAAIQQKRQDKCAINYYATVNYFVGPVLYREVSGTTGLERKYRVSLLGARVCGAQRGGVLPFSQGLVDEKPPLFLILPVQPD